MWVLKLGGSLCEPTGPANDTAPLRDWLAMLAQAGAGRVVIVPGGGRFADAVREAQAQWHVDDLTAHHMALLAMAQTAHLLCGLHPALRRCDREDQLPGALKQGGVAVWAPIDLRRDQADADTHWDTTSDSIALGLARRLGARRLVVVKSCAIDPTATWAQLGAAGVVDRRFATLASGASMPIEIVPHTQCDRIRVALLDEGTEPR